MARWFVGQRVRLVRPWLGYLYPDAVADWNRLKGQEGVIMATPSFNEYGDLAVTVRVRSGDVYMPEYGLEPILPEGIRPVSWSECLWQPEGETA